MQRLITKNGVVIFLCGLLIEILLLYFVFTQGAEKAIQSYMIIFGLVTLIAFSLYYFILRNKITFERKYIILIVAFALLFRITLLFTSPSTSDDVYRYVWEGKLVTHGINPFEVPPDSDKLDFLQSENLPAKVSFPSMTTIYPPIAQLVFAAGYLISGENDFGIKLIYLLAELVTMFFVFKILQLYHKNEYAVLLYAWIALPIMEYFINSHVDAIGISFFIMAIYFLLVNKPLQFSLAYSFAILSKLFPLFFVFVIIRKLGWKKSLIYGPIVLFIVVVFTLPFIPQEREISASLFTYLSQWSFNGSIYKILVSIFSEVSTSRLIVLALFGISTIYISFNYRDTLKAVYLIWISFIVFAPTLYPWYLGWIAAINPMFSFASVNSLLLTINVSNFTPFATEWTEYWWSALIQYIPFYTLLIWDLYKTKERKYESK